MVNTLPKVFIIESLSFKDEKLERFEGHFLSHILKQGGIDTEYFYIRTKKEFFEVLRIFNESKYRYLHISCHGNEDGLSTTLDYITHLEFSKITKGHLENRRLFLSACSATNRQFAVSVIPSAKCLSVIGPATDIKFNDSAIVWASFYHLIFKENLKGMKRKNILPVLRTIVRTFKLQMNYYSSDNSMRSGVKGNIIKIKEDS